MPFHFCMDELMMIMMGLPFIGGIIMTLRVRFGRKKKKIEIECCKHPHTHELPEAVVVSVEDAKS